MILEGDASVIDAIKEKKRLIEAGEAHDHIRPLLIMDGGFMKGVYGVGAAVMMEELGYLGVFNFFGGISSGAVTLAYTLAGQARLGSTIIWEECCSKEFLSAWRWRNPEDSFYFKSVLEGATGKRLQTEKLIPRRDFFVGVTRFADAAPVLLQPQTHEACVTSIQASMSMPGAVSDPVYVNSERYVDGASSNPLISQKMLEAVPATHVLIITNQDKYTGDILWWDRLISQTLWRRRFSPALLSSALSRRIRRHAWVQEQLANATTPMCFVWGDGSVESFERDAQKVKATVERSREWWQTLLSGDGT